MHVRVAPVHLGNNATKLYLSGWVEFAMNGVMGIGKTEAE
jgi:hypothetical protein